MTPFPQYYEAPYESLPSIVAQLRTSFFSQKTLPLEWRKIQLRKLYWAVKDNEELIVEALRRDLRKPRLEAYAAEILWVESDILYILDHLDEWAKSEKGDVILRYRSLNPKIRKEPLGVVLIIGPFNYPFQLNLAPFIGAIAAGNAAIIKPSENAPASAAVLAYLVDNYLDQNYYRVLNGGKDFTTSLLKEKFDKIVFTGSTFVGKIVAKAASEHLTPCILELGGLNPAIVTKSANVKLAARRIAWGKTFNVGQACISTNYALVHPDVEEEFIVEYKATIEEWLGTDPKNSPDLARIINRQSFHKIKRLVDSSSGKIVHGGEFDEETLYVSPTVVKVESANDPLIREETFGPVLPVLAVRDLEECFTLIRDIGDTPLALYAFTDNKDEQKRVLDSIRSGGASINDTMFHASIPTLPFGGVGNSGYGTLKGKASFDAFVHRRTVIKTPSWLERFLAMRYPPYSDSKLRQHTALLGKPSFDREGRVKTSILFKILTLGARSKVGGLLQWMVLIFSCYILKRQFFSRSTY